MLPRHRYRLIGFSLAIGIVLVAVLVAARDQSAALIEAVPAVERFYTRWVPPAPPPQVAEAIGPAEREAIARLGTRITGRLVWSSNREGNHDLYLAVIGTGELRRLTHDPHVDYFSRFSPDGTRISFLRSRRPWVSFRETDAWDLFVMNADGSNVQRLAEHAYSPTWIPDGSGLVFLRDNVVMRIDLARGREDMVQDGSVAPLEGRLGEAELGRDGRLAVTMRRREQRVGVLDDDRTAYTALSDPKACQITWHPRENRVLWIAGTGHGGTRVMEGSPDAPGGEVLMDLPGSYSHEYFPRLSQDGAWLVWGAAAEGHEHDRADYEIFVWRVGSPWDDAMRLTFSEANDQWPDLFIDP